MGSHADFPACVKPEVADQSDPETMINESDHTTKSSNFLKELETDSRISQKLISMLIGEIRNTRYSLKNSINEKFQKVRNHISRYEMGETEIREAIIASSLKDLSVWKAYLSWESINNECSFGIHQKKVIRELPKPKGMPRVDTQIGSNRRDSWTFHFFQNCSRTIRNNISIRYLDSVIQKI